jgi:hypothetical protein
MFEGGEEEKKAGFPHTRSFSATSTSKTLDRFIDPFYNNARVVCCATTTTRQPPSSSCKQKGKQI